VARVLLLALAALVPMASAAPAQPTALDRAVERLFHPYSVPPVVRAPAVWERPIWSRDTASLIARWSKATPRDHVDDLSDGDWLCQCQDWDQHAFRLSIRSRRFDRPRRATVDVEFRVGGTDWRSARLLLRLEGKTWKLDDLFARDSYPAGLRAALRKTIAEDRKPL